ncbi:MAG: phenylalanine--tRNA ligase subunit beta, partial [Alphaproteobacteria bacterium]|nr:phenylalanine--tRNA ligase subunit beta [Alphaproteobacteria bacterium]
RAARGIAGVMGGEETGCSDSTKNVFVESAYFDPVRTARTGRKLQIQSDARYRFERGVDPEFVLPGLELATALIVEWCGGEPSEIVVAGKVPAWRREIQFDPAFVEKIAAIPLTAKESGQILERLGCKVEERQGGMSVTPPSWRGDLLAKEDLVEEVVRIHGIDDVPSTPMPRASWVAKPTLTPAQRRTRAVRRALASRGLHETLNFTFIARDKARLFGGGDEARQVVNPIAAHLDSMRPSLLPSLLAAAQRNISRGFDDIALFEIGAQFENGMPGGQTNVAAAIRCGSGRRSWSGPTRPPDLFDAKADMLAAVEIAMGGQMNAPITQGAAPWYHPGQSGTLALGQKKIAWFGALHPSVLAACDIKIPAVAFELFLDLIPPAKSKGHTRAPFQPSPYQASDRDFAFVVDRDVPAETLLRAARAADRTLIERVDLFDVYEGKGVPQGKKSVAIAVRIQSRQKTLTEAEIDAVAQKIVAAVAKDANAELRT